ncbi:MAG: copper amine oxidase N-terminal domain-containing protein [Bacillota bacterium]
MIKARNKKISLLLAIVFMLTLVLPMGSAFAGDPVTFSSSVATVKDDGSDQDCGWIKMTIDSDVYSDVAALYVTVTLPDEVEFYHWNSTSKTLPAESNFVSGGTGTWVKQDKDDYTMKIVPSSANVKLLFSGDASLKINEDAADSVDVKVTVKAVDSSDLQLWTAEATKTIAKTDSAKITVTADDPETISVGSDKALATIYVTENIVKALSTSDYIYFDLPNDDDFKWSSSLDGKVIDGKYQLRGQLKVWDADTLGLAITRQSSVFPDELELDLTCTVFPSADEGDVVVDVTANTDNVEEASLVVAKIGKSDVTVKTDDDAAGVTDDMYIAMDNIQLYDITLESSGTFSKGDDLYITLPKGFEFTSAMDSATFTNWTNKGRYNGNKSLWLVVNADGKDELDISGLKVNALYDAPVGDIKLTLSGDVVETTVVAGVAKARLTATATTPDVIVGLKQAAGEITITETEKGSLSNGDVLTLDLPSGVEFNGDPDVFVNGDEKDNAAKVQSSAKDKCDITLAGLSASKKDTIVIKGINLDIDSRMALGQIKVAFKGNAVNKLSDADDKTEAVGESLPIANVVDAKKVTKSFKVGDPGVAVKNGRTLVQVNTLCDVLGLSKSWDAASKTAYFVKSGTVVAFPMGKNQILINGNPIPVDQGGVIIDGATYATLRGLEMAFGGKLSWDAATKTATFEF